MTGIQAKQNLRKKNMFYVHIGVVVFFMFGFGTIFPPFGAITSLGMKILGIFLGLLYGWTACSLIWPSLLSMIAITSTGMLNMKQFFAISFGNDTVMFLFFMFIFTAVVDEVGLVKFIANWFISRKYLTARPWLFSFVLLIGAFVSGGAINMFVAIIVFWGIIYIVAEKFGFQRYDAYPTLMVFGTVVASSIGGCVLPYKLLPLALLGTYQAVTGGEVNFLQYVCFSLPVAFLTIVVFILFCRYIVRPDMKNLSNLSIDFVNEEDLLLNKKQKTAFGFLGVFLVLMLAPGILPKQWAVSQFLDQIGIGGVVIGLIVIMFWVQFDGQPLMNFKRMASNGINWEMFIIFTTVIPFTSIFTNEATGIQPFIIQSLMPILEGKTPLIFIILVLLLATIITNFANNMVVGAAFIPVIYAMGADLGINVPAVVCVLIFAVSLAFVTPAASPGAALIFSNTDWVKASDMYKYGALYVVITFIVVATFGILWSNLIY